MLRLIAAIVWAVLVSAAPLARAETESRVALVIGNGAYRYAHRLANPVNDANAMSETLQRLGFDVVSVVDTDRVGMVRALGQFRKLMRADGVGLFYYAGHGLQVRGHNYLLPVDADIGDENDAALLAIDLETVQNEMERAGVRLSLYVLDACRDDPFERRIRSTGSRGLAPVDAARGSVIAFATAPGKTAADGTGEHGLFTGELLKAIVRPGLELEDVLKQTAAGVETASGNQQTPWYNSAFHGHFYFKSSVAVNVAPPPPASGDRDLVFWESVKSSTDPADYEDFVKKFPNSEFASLAQRRLTALQTPPTPSAPVQPPASAVARALPPPAPTNAPTLPAPPQPAATPAPGKTPDKETAVAVMTPPPPPPPADGEATWSLDEKREVQQALHALGHLQGVADGDFGPQTRTAISQFQLFQNESQTGQLSETQRKELLDMAHRLAALIDQPPASPKGVAAVSIRGGAERLARAANSAAAGDRADAAYWYRVAAADGEARAFTNLGTLMVRGQGAEKPDAAAARLLWLAAAARAEPIAMFNLGAMYERGIGVGADPAAARQWYERAAAHGHLEAREALKRLKP